ncbi:MAG: 50S ribosomal protein L32 [Candidatus Parcubacteria bacterium]|nr:50S ribosomal protein L32 [Candidatus Parcubacteria bacterium]
MALPNQKRAKSRKRVRQYRLRLTKKTLGKCSKCGKAIMPHRVCSFCGYYKNQEIIAPKVKGHKHEEHEHKEHHKEKHEHDHDHNHEKEQKEKHEHKK